MCKNDNLNLQKQKMQQRRDELETILNWKVIPKIEGKDDDEYKVIISYHEDSSKEENIKILGSYTKNEIAGEILAFCKKFLQDVNSFGLLIESQDKQELKNFDISFGKKNK